MVHTLRWSDIWFLVSLYLCRDRQEILLRDVVAAGDGINHAVMTFEEASSAMVRLEGRGLIVVQVNPCRPKCTSEGIATVAAVAKRCSYFRTMEKLEKKLGALPWEPKETHPHPDNALPYPGFAKEEYAKEVHAYHKAMRTLER